MPLPPLSLSPELQVSEWFNSAAPPTLAQLRGQVVFLHAFQLLCPGCVAHAIPQLQRIERVFAGAGLQILGLHTVFEHHQAMTPVTLRAFLQEYRITTPVGVDMTDPHSDIPLTMQRYVFEGTPSSVLIGRDGRILHQSFGVEDDLVLGALIAMALQAPAPGREAPDDKDGCASGTCTIPSAA